MTERSEDDNGSIEIEQGATALETSPAVTQQGLAELEKGPIELMTAAQEAWRKLPPSDSAPPAKSLSSAEFYAQFDAIFPPKVYRPASDFPEVPDPEERADALYWAFEMGEINLLCPDIRALIESLAGTYRGHLLVFLIHPEWRELKKPKRRKSRFKPAKGLTPWMTSLFKVAEERAVEEPLPKEADED